MRTYAFGLWRLSQSSSLSRIIEDLTYKRAVNPSVDTTYYLYVLKFLQLLDGTGAAAREVRELIRECSVLAQRLPRTWSYEWLGTGSGLSRLVHHTRLGEWRNEKDFYENEAPLVIVDASVAKVDGGGSGQLELASGIPAFFVPAKVVGGSVTQRDRNERVRCYIGFSYDGLRAWSVRRS
jgi:hypothetical protein